MQKVKMLKHTSNELTIQMIWLTTQFLMSEFCLTSSWCHSLAGKVYCSLVSVCYTYSQRAPSSPPLTLSSTVGATSSVSICPTLATLYLETRYMRHPLSENCAVDFAFMHKPWHSRIQWQAIVWQLTPIGVTSCLLVSNFREVFRSSLFKHSTTDQITIPFYYSPKCRMMRFSTSWRILLRRWVCC